MRPHVFIQGLFLPSSPGVALAVLLHMVSQECFAFVLSLDRSTASFLSFFEAEGTKSSLQMFALACTLLVNTV